VGKLIYATLDLHCVVYDSIGKQVYAIPEDNLEGYECSKMVKLIGNEVCVDSPHVRCNKNCDMTVCQSVSCFYGISNVIVPVKSEDGYIATLIVGPILTKDPNEILRDHMSYKPNVTIDEMRVFRAALSALKQQDISFCAALAQLISMLLNMDAPESDIHTIPIDKLEGSDISISDYPSAIQAAIDYISENYMNRISLSDVASAAFVHPTYLSRLFHHYTGCSFREYINRLRITKARRLLLNPSKSILEISCEVGFFDQSYFSRVFKMIEGVTPGQYRKNNLPDYRVLMSFSNRRDNPEEWEGRRMIPQVMTG